MEIKYKSAIYIFFLEYMKNGLLLTLKQLIKLGIIKFKKKRRDRRPLASGSGSSRNKSKIGEKDAFEKALNTSVPVNPQTRRYADFVGSTAPPQFQPNTDALRLRDSNDNFNTRLLENKNDLVRQKLLLNDQQLRQQALENDVDIGRQIIMRELKPITYQSGYVINDPIDVSQTFGSSTFEPQTSQPTTPEQSSAIPPTPRSLAEDDFFTSDAEPVLEPPPINEPLIQSDSDEERVVPYVRVQKRKTQPRTKPKTRRGVSFSDEEGKPLTFEKAEEAGGGGAPINFPNEPVPKHNNSIHLVQKEFRIPKGEHHPLLKFNNGNNGIYY